MFNFEFKLFRFDDGAGAESSSSETVGETVETPATTESNESQSSADDDRQSLWNDAKTKFKAEYDQEVQTHIKDRVKKYNKQINDLQGSLKSLAPVLEHLASQYGCDSKDINSIVNGFVNDDKRLEDLAYEKGMTLEQYKQFESMERENRRLKEFEEEQRRQEVYARWDREAEEVKTIYPSFDFNAEMESPEFLRLMDAGLPIQKAYEVAHMDELMSNAMQFTAQKASEKVANSVKANAQRPSEAGLSSAASSISRVDISSLSLEQMRDYVNRSKSGEKITFRE